MKIQKKQEIEFFGTKTGNANSIALGYATETKNFGEVAVGVMNKSTAAKDPNSSKGVCADPDATLFSVGCGGSGERKNALEVKGDGSVIIPGENGDINVADKIKQVLDTDASIELVKSTDSDLQYTLMVNNESRGSINIPKDQFLKNVTYDTEAKQLVFTFVTLDEEEHVERISINDLKDVYTAGNGINIDNNVISADFSSVMTAISDEKTQRETTDNEIKSTLDSKADKSEIMTVHRTDDSEYATIQTFAHRRHTNVNFGINRNGQIANGIIVYDEYGKVSIDGQGVIINSDDNDSGSDGFFVYFNEETGTTVGSLTPYGVICDGLPQKDTEVLTTNGHSVDLTKYALKSTLDTKADLKDTKRAVTCATNNSISGSFDNDGNKQESYGYHCVDVGFDNQRFASDNIVCIGSDNTELGRGSDAICIGNSNSFRDSSVCVGSYINFGGISSSTCIGSNINIKNDYGNCATIIGSYNTSDGDTIPNGFINIGYTPYSHNDGTILYQIGGFDEQSYGKNYNLETTLNSTHSHQKYIYGIGGYDGTNHAAEGIKSLQEVLTGKADASAIPTKVSQLTNDSGYLTEHQSLDNCVKIGDDNTPTQLFKGQGIATVNAQQLILGSPSGGVDIRPNSINVSSPSFTFKANPTEGLGFIANTVSKGVFLTPQGGVNSIGFNANDAIVEIGGSLVGQDTAGAVYNVNGNFVNLNPLYTFKAKFENSIVLNSALNNITAATTAEEVVTKFNALLADLKAKGFMTADITA